jgi:adenylate cyclase
MLDEHLSAMTEVILTHEGTVDTFVGDSVMALYNVPERQPAHAWRAIQTALNMQQAHRVLIQRRPDLPPISPGVDTGEVIVGDLGSTQRLEYTVVGHLVNLAARLCGAAEGDQLLISAVTYELVRDRVQAEPVAAFRLKGLVDTVAAYQVVGLK